MSSPEAYQRELLKNQIWQILNFGAKAGFLLLLTPLMLRYWGTVNYGLFALCSSLLVSMALLDGGVRNLTRLRITKAERDHNPAVRRKALAEGLFAFGYIVIAATAIAFVLAWTGKLDEWLNLTRGSGWVLAITVTLTGLSMLSSLALEPLAARGELSLLKKANTIGAVAAIPIAAALVVAGCSVWQIIVAYSLCLIIPNVALFKAAGLFQMRPWLELPNISLPVVFQTLHSGIWYYLTTVALIAKTHLLTFAVSALTGPAEAGVFYILLRVTEIIGNVGATASETSLAALAAAKKYEEKKSAFQQSWLYVAIFCLHGAVALTILGRPLLETWLAKSEPLSLSIGFAMACFGLSGAVSRVIINASMGLNVIRPAALGNLGEAALGIGLAILGYKHFGLSGLFLGGSIGIICLTYSAWLVTQCCQTNWVTLYIKPLLFMTFGLISSICLQLTAYFFHSLVGYIVALALSGLIALLQLKQAHHLSSRA